MLHHLRRHTATGIPHLGDDALFVRKLAQAHRSPRFCKLKGVGQQVVPYQLHEFFICLNHGTVFHVSFKINLFLLPDGLEADGAVAELAAEIVWLRFWMYFLAFQFVQLQNVVDQRCEALCARQNPFCIFLLFRSQLRGAKQLRIVLDGCQRRLQFMRNVGRKIIFQCLDGTQFLHHLIKIHKQRVNIIHIIGCMAFGNVDGKIPLRHLSGRGAQLLYRAVKIQILPQGQPTGYESRKNNTIQKIPFYIGTRFFQYEMGAAVEDRRQHHQNRQKKHQRNIGWKKEITAGDPSILRTMVSRHNSTALYPSPRIVLISNSLQAENLSRSFVI